MKFHILWQKSVLIIKYVTKLFIIFTHLKFPLKLQMWSFLYLLHVSLMTLWNIIFNLNSTNRSVKKLPILSCWKYVWAKRGTESNTKFKKNVYILIFLKSVFSFQKNLITHEEFCSSPLLHLFLIIVLLLIVLLYYIIVIDDSNFRLHCLTLKYSIDSTNRNFKKAIK